MTFGNQIVPKSCGIDGSGVPQPGLERIPAGARVLATPLLIELIDGEPKRMWSSVGNVFLAIDKSAPN